MAIITTLYTHGGKPHLDDAICGFIASVFGAKVVRVNMLPEHVDVNAYEGNIAADIGGGVYDHHSADTPKRADGFTHCGASLMWEYFGEDVIRTMYPDCKKPEYVAYRVDKDILSTVSSYDNGEGEPGVYTIYQAAAAFVPAWNSTKTMDEAYSDMVNFASGIITRLCEYVIAALDAETVVTGALSDMKNGIVVMDRFAPWQSYVIPNEDAKFVVFPGIRGGWNLQVVPNSFRDREPRCSFPVEWLGKSGDAAKKERRGMTFCHPGNFLATFGTKTAAIAAAKRLIKVQQEKKEETKKALEAVGWSVVRFKKEGVNICSPETLAYCSDVYYKKVSDLETYTPIEKDIIIATDGKYHKIYIEKVDCGTWHDLPSPAIISLAVKSYDAGIDNGCEKECTACYNKEEEED